MATKLDKKLSQKLEQLQTWFAECGSVLIAYSGGVDSTFLLKVATETLSKEKVLGVTIKSELFPEFELQQAIDVARRYNFNHLVMNHSELSIKGFDENPPDRCYLCKKGLFEFLKSQAQKGGLAAVVDGSTSDDTRDYRPGLKALKELDIKSPLKELKFSKQEIRYLSREMGLPTWDKPSMACLASRFPYGVKITAQRLKMVEQAEAHLRSLGFKQCRVRYHNRIARIEVATSDFANLLSPEVKESIVSKLKSLGFTYITLDLEGYRTGSLNLMLSNKGGK